MLILWELEPKTGLRYQHVKRCPHGMSPAVECLMDYRTCPCGYAEGLSDPHYPVPAPRIEVWLDCLSCFSGEWKIDPVIVRDNGDDTYTPVVSL